MTDNRESCWECGDEFSHLSSAEWYQRAYCNKPKCKEAMNKRRAEEDD